MIRKTPASRFAPSAGGQTGVGSSGSGFSLPAQTLDNPAEWVRKITLKLSQTAATPIPFWLSLPVMDLKRWVRSANENAEEKQKYREEHQRTRYTRGK